MVKPFSPVEQAVFDLFPEVPFYIPGKYVDSDHRPLFLWLFFELKLSQQINIWNTLVELIALGREKEATQQKKIFIMSRTRSPLRELLLSFLSEEYIFPFLLALAEALWEQER